MTTTTYLITRGRREHSHTLVEAPSAQAALDAHLEGHRDVPALDADGRAVLGCDREPVHVRAVSDAELAAWGVS